jgi:hypothetical protein
LPVAARTTLALKGAAVTHAGKVLVIVPYIGKFLLRHIAAVYRQVSAGKYIPLMPNEQHTEPGKAAPRRASHGANVSVERNTIYHNYGGYRGGGIYVRQNYQIIRNNLIFP